MKDLKLTNVMPKKASLIIIGRKSFDERCSKEIGELRITIITFVTVMLCQIVQQKVIVVLSQCSFSVTTVSILFEMLSGRILDNKKVCQLINSPTENRKSTQS